MKQVRAALCVDRRRSHTAFAFNHVAYCVFVFAMCQNYVLVVVSEWVEFNAPPGPTLCREGRWANTASSFYTKSAK